MCLLWRERKKYQKLWTVIERERETKKRNRYGLGKFMGGEERRLLFLFLFFCFQKVEEKERERANCFFHSILGEDSRLYFTIFRVLEPDVVS